MPVIGSTCITKRRLIFQLEDSDTSCKISIVYCQGFIICFSYDNVLIPLYEIHSLSMVATAHVLL